MGKAGVNKLISNFNIGETVEVKYDNPQSVPNFTGQIVRISFTKMKVSYDVLADSNAEVYKNIDSIYINKV